MAAYSNSENVYLKKTKADLLKHFFSVTLPPFPDSCKNIRQICWWKHHCHCYITIEMAGKQVQRLQGYNNSRESTLWNFEHRTTNIPRQLWLPFQATLKYILFVSAINHSWNHQSEQNHFNNQRKQTKQLWNMQNSTCTVYSLKTDLRLSWRCKNMAG